jgi:hypothetical protein
VVPFDERIFAGGCQQSPIRGYSPNTQAYASAQYENMPRYAASIVHVQEYRTDEMFDRFDLPRACVLIVDQPKTTMLWALMYQSEKISVIGSDDKSLFLCRPIENVLVGCSGSQNAIGVNRIDFRSESYG